MSEIEGITPLNGLTETERHALALKINQGTATPAEVEAYQRATTEALEAALGQEYNDYGIPIPASYSQTCGLCGHTFRVVERQVMFKRGYWEFIDPCEHYSKVYGDRSGQAP